ncbi:GNAT family N-acetyltransferase [Micromonospora sediminicola]|uniref:GNAT family N-acetyltransferase n=1 Tax=Micromonospora sediminicola TaxID=946078 RepID=UPI002480C2F6|nr:GNAT family protein [Micromonospora sediminicola]
MGLRARQASDVAVLHDELYNDVDTRSRADTRAWRPIPEGSTASPYALTEPTDEAACFSVVRLSDGELAGEALLWGIDSHNRSGHLGLSLRPRLRGARLGEDATRLLCHYGFRTLGLHRLQMETLVDNSAMIRIANQVGFRREGIRRQAAWVDGTFADELTFGLLASEWAEARDGTAGHSPTSSSRA